MSYKVEIHHGGYIVGGVLVQSDWDFPRAARMIGWNMKRVQPGKVLKRAPKNGCNHNGTDGTIACPQCGVTNSEFINAAAYYLDGRSS